MDMKKEKSIITTQDNIFCYFTLVLWSSLKCFGNKEVPKNYCNECHSVNQDHLYD